MKKVSDSMLTKRPQRQYVSEIVNLEDMVPQNHFLRVIEVQKIVKSNEEIPTEELLGEKEIIVSDTDKGAGMLY